MTPDQLEERLEEWARWVQGGSAPAQLGYGSTSPGFGDSSAKPHGQLISSERQMEIEAAVAELQLLGEGIKDEVRGKWTRKPNKGYMNCAEILRAEYKAHPSYGDARYESPGSSVGKTLRQIGVSQRTYYSKLRLAKSFINSIHAKLSNANN